MIARHRINPAPGSAKVDDVGVKKFEVSPSAITAPYSDSILDRSAKEPSPDDMPPALQDVTPAATHVHTPASAATPVIDEGHHNTSDATGAMSQEVHAPTNAGHASIVSGMRTCNQLAVYPPYHNNHVGSPLSRTTVG